MCFNERKLMLKAQISFFFLTSLVFGAGFHLFLWFFFQLLRKYRKFDLLLQTNERKKIHDFYNQQFAEQIQFFFCNDLSYLIGIATNLCRKTQQILSLSFINWIFLPYIVISLNFKCFFLALIVLYMTCFIIIESMVNSINLPFICHTFHAFHYIYPLIDIIF